MARLRYSVGAFDRALMMVRVPLVAIVEGIEDILFYERMLREYVEERALGLHFQVRTPLEVSGPADGKKALLGIFKRLRAKNRLKMSSGGGKSLVFFADRDYDDFTRSKLKNRHLIYTRGVMHENDLFECGDVAGAIECVVGRSLPANAISVQRSRADWKRACARVWREWLIYCIVCEVSGVAPRKNRGGPSKVHQGNPPALNAAEFGRLIAEVETASGDPPRIAKILRRATIAVDRAISSSSTDGVFCGKWYSYLLRDELARLGAPFASLAHKVAQKGAIRSLLLKDFSLTGAAKNYYFDLIDSAVA